MTQATNKGITMKQAAKTAVVFISRVPAPVDDADGDYRECSRGAIWKVYSSGSVKRITEYSR